MRKLRKRQAGQLKLAPTRPRKRIDVGKEARRRARERAGAPPAERVIPDKRRKPPKHKKRELERELG